MAETQGQLILNQVRKLVAVQGTRRLTDHQLLEQFLARQDETAFAALVERHGPTVLSLCRSFLHHLQDAEDVFQATFLVLARKAASIRKREALGSWLHGVAHRLACKARVRAARRDSREVTTTVEVEARSTDDLTWRELRLVLHEEISRLPEKYRAPLLLCYWEGKTQEEAAAQLGWRKGTLKERVHRARELLRGRLTRRGLTLPAGLATALLCGRTGTTAAASALVGPTTKAALAFAVGNKAVAGGVSAVAATLAEGVVQTMFLTKLKIAAVVLLTLGLLGAGTAAVICPASDGDQVAQGAKAQPGKPKTDHDRLQGTWVLVSGERGGEPPPEGFLGGFKLTFAGDKFSIQLKGETKGPGAYMLDPAKTPREINLTPDGQNLRGIYRLKGDELTLCLDENRGPRPTEFKSPAGTNHLLLVLRREKAVGDKAPKGGESPPKGDAKDEKDPAKLQLRIKELQRELLRTREELDAAKRQLELARALAEQARAEALAQRDLAERARRQAEQELERARAAERAARAAAEAIQGDAAKRQVSANNLKQLALAMHNYHDAHGHFPPAAIYSKDGKPLLSWRVLLLPYLEQENLYKQFKLDEPWDSAHNKALLKANPKVFGLVDGKTHYRVFTGEGTVFKGKEGMRLQTITDGASNTILIVEASEAVPWTKPEELPYDAKKALPKLGSVGKDGFHIGLADGSVRFIRPPVNEEILRAAITANGGETVDLDKLGR